MARIVFGTYMARYPLGGMLSAGLGWLRGFADLGHEVYLVEKSGWQDACFDPSTGRMSDDSSYGTAAVAALLARFGLADRWCYVGADGEYHGLSRQHVRKLFRDAAAFVDFGSHGAWSEEAARCGVRILVDGEPAANQMKMEQRLAAGEQLAEYDLCFSLGRNVGTNTSTAPRAGRSWRPLFPPVAARLFSANGGDRRRPFTTVMKWRSHKPIEFRGITYGQKDVEFENFLGLPTLTSAALEVAVSGRGSPRGRLADSGWGVRDGHAVSRSFDSFRDYIQGSGGEFSVAKNVFVATNSGWFSDRSAAYLASGRPVVLQETGFSEHLPCGEGLFAVRTTGEAAAAFESISADYPRHARAARALALDYLDGRKVARALLSEAGV
jgi:hypothetical protein